MKISKEVEIGFSNREEWAIDRVYGAVFPFLKWTAFSYIGNEIDAEDIAEEAIVAALEDFSPDKGDLLGFLLVATRNLSISLLRKKSKIISLEEAAFDEIASKESEMASLLANIKEIIGEEDYELVVSVAVFGVPLAEMAKITGENLSTLKSRYYRALKLLRSKLKKGGRWL